MSETVISPEELSALAGQGFSYDKKAGTFCAQAAAFNGEFSALQLRSLSEAAERFGAGQVRFNSQLAAEIPGLDRADLEAFRQRMAEAGLEMCPWGSRVRPVLACRSPACRFGSVDAAGLARELQTRFFIGYRDVPLPHKFKFAVGGCANGCVRHDLCDVGFTGRENAYRLLLGGRGGRHMTKGRPVSREFSRREDLLQAAESALLLYIDRAEPKERFGAMLERLGFENAEALILSGELLERKAEILRR